MTPQDRVMHKYVDLGAYILAIEDGREQLQLTDLLWSSTVQRGTTIVMGILVGQPSYRKSYLCPFCDCCNKLNENDRKSSANWWAFFTPFSGCGSAHRLSVVPASGVSRSPPLLIMFVAISGSTRKLWPFPTTSGT